MQVGASVQLACLQSPLSGNSFKQLRLRANSFLGAASDLQALTNFAQLVQYCWRDRELPAQYAVSLDLLCSSCVICTVSCMVRTASLYRMTNLQRLPTS